MRTIRASVGCAVILVHLMACPAFCVDAFTFHYGTMSRGGSPRGLLAASTVLLHWADQPPDRTRDQFEHTLFGPSLPNVASLFQAMSADRFQLIDGGIYGPIAPLDDPDTVLDESTWHDSVDPTNPRWLYFGLRAANGKYVQATDGGGSTAAALGEGLLPWETFALVAISASDGHLFSGDTVAIKTAQGNYLRKGPAGTLIADAVDPNGVDRRFTVLKYGGSPGTGIQTGDDILLLSIAQPARLIRVLHDGTGTLLMDQSIPTADMVFTIEKTRRDGLRTTRQVFDLLIHEGLDLQSKDSDGNGVITNDELPLWVVEMDAQPAAWGQTRNPAGRFRPAGARVDVASSQCYVGEDSPIHTFAHEMAHQFGAVDLYGHDGVRNGGGSLMGATLPTLAYLDPWHRMRLGWLEPRILALHDPERLEIALRMPESGGTQAHAHKQPLLLYDPSRYDAAARRGEYFLLEFRNWLSPTAIHDVGMAVGQRPVGLALWQIETNEGGWPVLLPAVGVTGFDASVNLLAAPIPGLSSPYVRGNWELWSDADGVIVPRYSDGVAATAQVRILTSVREDTEEITICVATGNSSSTCDGPPPSTTSTIIGATPTTSTTTAGIPTTTSTTLPPCVSRVAECEIALLRPLLPPACELGCNCKLQRILTALARRTQRADAAKTPAACRRNLAAALRFGQRLAAALHRRGCPQSLAAVAAADALRNRLTTLRSEGFCIR